MSRALYVVLASDMREVDRWRRDNEKPARAVIGCTPRNARTGLRGLTGPIEVIVSETWGNVSADVLASVQRDLEIIRATTPKERADG